MREKVFKTLTLVEDGKITVAEGTEKILTLINKKVDEAVTHMMKFKEFKGYTK